MKASPRILAVLALCATAPVFGQSQPAGMPPAEHNARQPETRSDIPDDPAEAKKQLEKRLEEFTKREERYREALKKIEQGVAPREAMKDLEPGRGMGDRRPDDSRRSSERRTGDERGPREPVTQKEREHALVFLQTNRPTLAARVDAVNKAHPDYAERGMNRLVPRLREAEDLLKRDPTQYELKMQEIEGQMAVLDAIRGFREASTATPVDPARLASATAALRSALATQLDVRISLQVFEIADLNRRLDDLKSDLDKKQANREATIDGMLTKIRDYRERSDAKDKSEAGDRGKPREGPGSR